MCLRRSLMASHIMRMMIMGVAFILMIMMNAIFMLVIMMRMVSIIVLVIMMRMVSIIVLMIVMLQIWLNLRTVLSVFWLRHLFRIILCQLFCKRYFFIFLTR